MKRIFTLLAFILVTSSIWAQVPQKMSYQAVIRNSSNVLVTSAAVGIKISVLQGTSTGTAVYVETHTTSTNANGLVSLQIGGGTVQSGTFAGINWANGPYFIKTETDPTGGTNYNISGTTELLSVPYALSAGQSSPAPGNAVGDMQYWNGTAWVLLPIGTAGQVLKVNNNIPQWTNPAIAVLSALTTDLVADIRTRKATITGTVTNDGGEFVFTRGFCFATTPTPTVTNGAVTTGNGLGTFSADITELVASTTYYVRAFATTTAGTSYGNELNFTTPNGIAIVTTVTATNIQACSATSGAILITDGGDDLFGLGICYSTSPNPTVADNPLYGGDTIDFTTSSPNTVYYYRAFAINSSGAFYGSILSFTTQNFTAAVSINAATQVKSCSATLTMAYTPVFPNAVDAYGICYGTSPLPTTNDNNLYIDATLTNTATCLTANTTYYARAYIMNCNGIKYGNQISFTTTNNNFTVTTGSPIQTTACYISISQSTVNYVSGDNSCFGGLAGLYYGTSPNPDENNGTHLSYNPNYYSLSELTANTTYYVRAYAIKCDGVTKVFGNQVQVTTLQKYVSLTTNPTTYITPGTATLNGAMIANGVDYLYGGFCYGTSPNPTVANNKTMVTGAYDSNIFSKNINGLTAGTTYYVRTYVENSNNCIGIIYGPQVTFTTTTGALVVGQYYNGGIIIKLNTPTCGIMVAETDQGTAAWGCEGLNIAGSSSAEGTGQANTNAIISGCTMLGTAAKICDALVLTGHSDWYLPSEAELLLVGDLNHFPPNNYWTSTQSTVTQAKIVNSGTSGTADKSDAAVRVRAVRSF